MADARTLLIYYFYTDLLPIMFNQIRYIAHFLFLYHHNYYNKYYAIFLAGIGYSYYVIVI